MRLSVCMCVSNSSQTEAGKDWKELYLNFRMGQRKRKLWSISLPERIELWQAYVGVIMIPHVCVYVSGVCAYVCVCVKKEES